MPHRATVRPLRSAIRSLGLAGCFLFAAAYASAAPRVVLCIFTWEQVPVFGGGVAVEMIVDDKIVVVSDHDLDRSLPEQKVVRSFHFDRPTDGWKCGDPHKAGDRDVFSRRCARLVSRTGNTIVMDFKNSVTDSQGHGREATIQFRVDLAGTCTAQLLKADAVKVPTPFRDLPEGGRVGPMNVKQQTCQVLTK